MVEGIRELTEALGGVGFWVGLLVAIVVVAMVAERVVRYRCELQSGIVKSFRDTAESYRKSSDRQAIKSDELEERLLAVERSNESLRDMVQSQEERINDLNKQIDNRNRRILELERKIAAMQTEIDARDERIAELEIQVNKLIELREALRKQ